MKVLFAGGGTAGHINPALAIADYIKTRHPDAQISYIGTAEKLEAKLVPAKGYDFYTIKVAGFRRSLSPKAILHNISAVKLAATSMMSAKKIIKKINPDIVIGTGGYVSGPVLKAAQKLGLKTAIHEQNAFPGVTTKMLAPNADKVMLAMGEAKKYLKLNKEPVVTGNPIRSELLSIDRKTARQKLGLGEKPLILSFGGSLGARRINEAISDVIKWHNGTNKFYHIHGTGKVGYEDMLANLNGTELCDDIKIREYIDDMDVCMAAADLVICRAGAITLGELQACGKPSILIPSPYVAENHQYHNALTLKKDGAAELIEEKDLTGQSLINMVDSLFADSDKLCKMATAAKENAIVDTNERIYKIIMELLSDS